MDHIRQRKARDLTCSRMPRRSSKCPLPSVLSLRLTEQVCDRWLSVAGACLRPLRSSRRRLDARPCPRVRGKGNSSRGALAVCCLSVLPLHASTRPQAPVLRCVHSSESKVQQSTVQVSVGRKAFSHLDTTHRLTLTLSLRDSQTGSQEKRESLGTLDSRLPRAIQR